MIPASGERDGYHLGSYCFLLYWIRFSTMKY
jgi:hypothetical protein